MIFNNKFWENKILEQLKTTDVLTKMVEKDNRKETIEKYNIGIAEVKKFMNENDENTIADVIYGLMVEVDKKENYIKNNEKDLKIFEKIRDLMNDEGYLYDEND